MNILSQFTTKQNISLLWDVLLDELHINQTNKPLMSNIRTVFESNIKPFTSRINPNANTNIMGLNKLFLSQVVLAVNKLFPKEQNIKRITITDEEIMEPYKIEDIQASRQTDFDKEVERKKVDLENYMIPQKPKELDFSDKAIDGKIIAMDSLVAEKMAQRNQEIEQFQNSNYNTTDIDPQQWLSSKETSVKGEKNIQQTNNANNSNNRLKHINIDNDNNVSLIKEKKVSWNDQEPTSNIFQKLKKKQEDRPIINVTDEQVEQKQYVEQKSTPLPDVREEPIIRPTTSINISQNVPIIPSNELIKQINEMNAKMNNLYDMVYKLTKMVEEKDKHPSISSTTDVQEICSNT